MTHNPAPKTPFTQCAAFSTGRLRPLVASSPGTATGSPADGSVSLIQSPDRDWCEARPPLPMSRPQWNDGPGELARSLGRTRRVGENATLRARRIDRARSDRQTLAVGVIG